MKTIIYLLIMSSIAVFTSVATITYFDYFPLSLEQPEPPAEVQNILPIPPNSCVYLVAVDKDTGQVRVIGVDDFAHDTFILCGRLNLTLTNRL